MKLALPDNYILSRHREQRPGYAEAKLQLRQGESCVAIQGRLTKPVFVTLDCHGAYAPRNDEVNHSIGYHPALKVSGE